MAIRMSNYTAVVLDRFLSAHGNTDYPLPRVTTGVRAEVSSATEAQPFGYAGLRLAEPQKGRFSRRWAPCAIVSSLDSTTGTIAR